jgi:hypothetical protein
LRGSVRDRGLSSVDNVIVTNLKRNVPMGSLLLETSAPNPYCLKMEGSMVMVRGSMTRKRGIALVKLGTVERELY